MFIIDKNNELYLINYDGGIYFNLDLDSELYNQIEKIIYENILDIKTSKTNFYIQTKDISNNSFQYKLYAAGDNTFHQIPNYGLDRKKYLLGIKDDNPIIIHDSPFKFYPGDNMLILDNQTSIITYYGFEKEGDSVLDEYINSNNNNITYQNLLEKYNIKDNKFVTSKITDILLNNNKILLNNLSGILAGGNLKASGSIEFNGLTKL